MVGLAGRLLGLVASKCLASLRRAPLGGGGYFMSHRFGGDRHSVRPFLAFRTHHFRVALHRCAEGFGVCGNRGLLRPVACGLRGDDRRQL